MGDDGSILDEAPLKRGQAAMEIRTVPARRRTRASVAAVVVLLLTQASAGWPRVHRLEADG